MARTVQRVLSLSPSGKALLEDGREMQLVVADTGSLGLRPIQQEDHVASLDQYQPTHDQAAPQATFPPSLASLGLDQSG